MFVSASPQRPTGTFVFFGRPTAAPIVVAQAPATVAPATEAPATEAATEAPATEAATEAPTTLPPPPSTTTEAPAPPPPAVYQPAYVVSEDNGPSNYEFQYGVNDDLAGVNLGHNENSNGKHS